MGLQSLSWSEIHAYFQLMNIKPMQWELELLCTIDSIYIDVMGSDEEVTTGF
ncbi:MAG: hypothetical protein KGV56_03385 [Gammaproteobacteria bacterium]|nr:hypothetical protein [Gammaproteobacteria bacterium]